jgi:probable rRNA maturation factor
MDDESPYDISITCQVAESPVSETQLRHAIETTLRQHARGAATVSVALVDDAQIAAMNQQYLGCTGPTDVMSFDLSEGNGAFDAELIVSAETARRESAQRGHTVEAEITLYAVHGMLHLLGFNDQSETDARAMHNEEDRILTELGYGPVYYGGGRCE